MMLYASEIEISIVIPVYNDQVGLEKTLLAIDEQECVDSLNFESVVVDNGSSPCITLPPDLKHVSSLIKCHRPGSYAARNEGVLNSRGCFLIFLDADCIPDKMWLFNAYSTMKNNVSSVFGGEVEFILSNKMSGTEVYQAIVGFCQEENIRLRKFTATANLFVSKDLFERVGGFDESLLSGGDREWCWRAGSLGCEVIFVPSARVFTWPRTALISAVRQARRVVGGRKMLQKITPANLELISAEKGIVKKFMKLWSAEGFSTILKVRAICAAAVIKIFRDVERFRLIVGFKPERR